MTMPDRRRAIGYDDVQPSIPSTCKPIPQSQSKDTHSAIFGSYVADLEELLEAFQKGEVLEQ